MPGDGREVGATAPPARTPRAALTPYVTRLAGSDMAGVDVVHHGVPTPALTVILSFGRPLRVGWSADPDRATERAMLLSGLHDGPAFIFPTAGHQGIQLDLTPLGARALCGLPAGAVAAELVDLEAVWGAAGRLADALDAAPDWATRLDTVERWLTAAVVPDAAIRPELGWAWTRLVGPDAAGVGPVADQIGWSRGYLTRLFAAEYGLRPKQLERVARFARARDAARRGGGLAELAARHGYADQAHLTREWRRLAGCTPTEWRTEMSAFVQDGPPDGAAGSGA